MSAKGQATYQEIALLTVALLGEEEIGLAGGGKVRDTIASVEESRALVGRQLGVGAEGKGLVVAEAAVVLLEKRPHNSISGKQLTSHHGTRSSSHPPGR